ncbi:MAG: BlaI/MecI/CopY family transcriptional regulator [Chloroflexi bacterium]|nr:MAG: BlaI/MecI/CopY family transcriptional regulator [Chloroflexota bacterium]
MSRRASSTSRATATTSSSSTRRSRTGARASPTATRASSRAGASAARARWDDRSVSAPLRRIRRAASGDLLGPLESAVMERLWKRGPATVRDVVDDLGRSRGLAYTTVMTVMVRLQAKGMLRRERNGKTYVYRPAFSREEHRARLSRDLARGLVSQFGDAALAAFSAELDDVDAAHRAALRRAAKESRDAR